MIRHSRGIVCGRDYLVVFHLITFVFAVGYGDKTPVTFLGRLLAVAWMFIGIILLGYMNGLMLAGYIDPPPRFYQFETWLDLRTHGIQYNAKFCAARDTFFNTTLAHEGLTPSLARSKPLDIVVFRDRLEDCYTMLLDEKVFSSALHAEVQTPEVLNSLADAQVAGVIDNLPRLIFDSKNSASNYRSPLGMCHDLSVSPIIEPVYHAAVVRRPSTDPGDFSRNLKCSLDAAIQAFQDGVSLFRCEWRLFHNMTSWSAALSRLGAFRLWDTPKICQQVSCPV